MEANANMDVAKMAGADSAAKNEVFQNLDNEYNEQLKRDQEAIEAKQKAEMAVDYDKVRKLGFATSKDIEEYTKNIYGKFVSELEAIRKENTALREWVMRAKAQGLSGSALDQKDEDPNAVSDYLKPFMHNKPKR